jgi:hypothetical protein
MLAVFIATPWLALIPALLFGLAYRARPVRPVLVAAVGWLTYFLYEESMRRRILCSGECNIRVDLLLIYPILLVLSIVAIVAAMRRPQ